MKSLQVGLNFHRRQGKEVGTDAEYNHEVFYPEPSEAIKSSGLDARSKTRRRFLI